MLKYLFGGGSRDLNILKEKDSEDLDLILELSEIESSLKIRSSLKIGSSSKAESSLKAGSSSEAESSEKPSHSLGQV